MSRNNSKEDDRPSAFAAPLKPSPDGWDNSLRSLSSNMYSLMVKSPFTFRFLKIVQKQQHSWYAVLGAYDGEDLPVVCFGNGHSYGSAMYSLGQSLAGDKWSGDKFA